VSDEACDLYLTHIKFMAHIEENPEDQTKTFQKFIKHKRAGYFQCIVTPMFNQDLSIVIYLPRIPVKGDLIELAHWYPQVEYDMYEVIGVTLYSSDTPASKKGFAAWVVVDFYRNNEGRLMINSPQLWN